MGLKTKGPLHVSLVQLLVLSSIAGISYLTFAKDKQLRKILVAAAKAVGYAWGTAEYILNKLRNRK